MVLKKINVLLKLKKCNLKEVKKDLGDEFSILEDGIYQLVLRKLLLTAGLNDADLNGMSRDKWLVQNLSDEAQQV